MVLSPEINGVDVHAAVVGPVVGQRDNELGADLLRGVDNLVEGSQIDDGGAVSLEPLKHNLGRFAGAVLGQPVGRVGAVLVIEAPRPEDGQPGIPGGCQPLFDVCLVLVDCQRPSGCSGMYLRC